MVGPPSTLTALNEAARERRRRIAVGTTTVRALESLPCPIPPGPAAAGVDADTSLFILPGFAFRHTDALITNFHLPRSTLLALVGAFLGGGVPRLLDLYRQAIDLDYRFYSYGDAMLILP
jgi:S-adenosylmethionine:tRNA ribosyltransferase-isomerase